MQSKICKFSEENCPLKQKGLCRLGHQISVPLKRSIMVQPCDNNKFRPKQPLGGAGDILDQEPPKRQFKQNCHFGTKCNRRSTCQYKHEDASQVQDQMNQPQDASQIQQRKYRPSEQPDSIQARKRGGMQQYVGKQGYAKEKFEDGPPQGKPKGQQPPQRMMQITPSGQDKKTPFSFTQLTQLKATAISDMKAELLTADFKGKLDVTQAENDIPSLVLQIVLRLLNDKDESSLRVGLLSEFLESKFIVKLKGYIDQVSTSKVRSYVDFENRFDFLSLAIEAFSTLLSMFPSKASAIPADTICFSADMLQRKMNDYLKEKPEVDIEKMAKRPESLKALSLQLKDTYYDSLQKAEEEEEMKKEEAKAQPTLQFVIPKDESYKLQPKEDFTLIDAIPGEIELANDFSSQIRRMPETGDLQSNNNYLDLLFRLLQEDAVCDLRSGVTLMKKIGRQQKNGKQFTKKEIFNQARRENVKLHEEMKIQGIQAVDGVACVTFRIVTNKAKYIDWKGSKKLLPGSLVLLSCDNFKTIFVGIIKSRDAILMNKTHKKFGFVPVNIDIVKFLNFDEPPQQVLDITERYSTKLFTMIESSAYFESYVHVLRSLQQMNSWPVIPFSQQIVKGESIMNRPNYLEQNVDLKISGIESFIKTLNLDDSQRVAMKNALTSELALIQGPPGTGKTYIGVQIVRYLLKNQEQWCSQGPILLVTYTNHALNQFIDHVSKYTNQIVRVGGKADDDNIKRFGLVECLKEVGNNTQYYKVKKVVESLKVDITHLHKEMENFHQGYVHSSLSKLKQGENDDEESEALCNQLHQIIERLQKAFSDYLEDVLQNYEDESFQFFVEDKLNKLRKQTGNNIIIIFWLGIIDLECYIANLNKSDYMQEMFQEREKEQKEERRDKKSTKEEERKKLEEMKKRDELEENDLDYMDEREKDYYLKNKKKEEFNEKLELSHQVIQDSFHQDTCCDKLHEKVSTFSEAVTMINEYRFGDMTEDEIKKEIEIATKNDPFGEIAIEARWALNNYILTKLKKSCEKNMETLVKKYSEAQQKIDKLSQLNAQTIFKRAYIVAMTTTGRSKYSEYFKNVTFPIVIVEEAAEVFEAHIITALSKETQHLILIGDHLQLKPNPAVYDLSFNFNLSLSMFERLISNSIPHSTLALQRRMRPEISKMMNIIYPALKDHDSVLKHPQIKGMSSSLYFYDHNFAESSNDLMMSKLNKEEADMIVRFAVYLLQNKYSPDNITILTLYAGQLLHIKQIVKDYKVLPDLLRRIRVINVDNYQGEENDIILLSLVRSNPESKIGFLKISNRVCVALSRARMGLFIFGNSKCLLGSKLQLWEDVFSYLKENGYFGDCLKFQCPNHKFVTEVKTVKDFHRIPEGGCNQKCDARMECGHSCVQICHPYELTAYDPTGHRQKICQKPCSRPLPCGHECTFKCFECQRVNQPCMTEIEVTMPLCGHTLKIQCRQNTRDFTCLAPCELTLKCGHRCKLQCGRKCASRVCKENVEYTLACGHINELQCHEDPLNAQCQKTCGYKLPCSHGCEGRCRDCNERGHHKICTKSCTKYLVCGHNCKDKCKETCSPCQTTFCYTKCIHSTCKSVCGKVCILCKEPCENKCPHSHCTNLCSEPCNRTPCNENCDQLLDCGHPCLGLCGEKCPQFCRVCTPEDEAFKPFFGNEGEADAKFIVLDCGHAFEVHGLDKYMHQEQTVIKYRECPRCKSPINKCGRYMKQINQTLNDINNVKAIIIESNEQMTTRFTQVSKQLDRMIAKDKGNVLIDANALTPLIVQLLKQLKVQFQVYELQRSAKYLNILIEDVEYVFDLQLINVFYSKLKLVSQFDLSLDRKMRTLLAQVSDTIEKEQCQEAYRSKAKLTKGEFLKLLPADTDCEVFRIKKLQFEISSNDWHKCANQHYFTAAKQEGPDQIFDQVNQECPRCSSALEAVQPQGAGELGKSQLA